jgi:hypothetical protein
MASELSGRELDAAVAVRVMQFKRTRYTRARIPAYSTDWAAAGLVIEEMRRHVDTEVWYRFCDALDLGGMLPICRLMQRISPELVCRAALAAMEAEDGK